MQNAKNVWRGIKRQHIEKTKYGRYFKFKLWILYMDKPQDEELIEPQDVWGLESHKKEPP